MPVYKDDPNLVSYWPLDEASGTRYDYCQRNNLTDNNTVLYDSADFKEGQACADFEDGNSEYLSITDAAQTGLDITGNITLCCWIKPETVNDDSRACIAKRLSSTQISYMLGFSVYTGGGDVDFYLSSDGTTITRAYTAAAAVAAGTWAHIAAVYDGTDMRIYVDGALASNGSNNPKAYSSGIYNGTAAFTLGAIATPAYYYDGKQDAAAVFNRALSAAEIASIYTSGIQNPIIFVRAKHMLENTLLRM
jgi:hypothetical protein